MALWERRKLHMRVTNYAAAHAAAMYHGAHGERPHPTPAEFMPYYEPPIISGAELVQKFIDLGARKSIPHE